AAIAKSLLLPLGTLNVSVMLLCPDTASVFVIVVIPGALMVNVIRLTSDGIPAITSSVLIISLNHLCACAKSVFFSILRLAVCPLPPTVRLTIEDDPPAEEEDEPAPPPPQDDNRTRIKKLMLNIF